MAPAPTHHITHKHDRSAVDIYIADSLYDRLEYDSGAQDSVCIAFREEGKKHYDAAWSRKHRYVTFRDLRITPLLIDDQFEGWNDGECCGYDECIECREQQVHQYCRLGCTLRRVA